jgi:hypothetical protein
VFGFTPPPDSDTRYTYGDSMISLRYAHIGNDTPVIAHNTDLLISTSVTHDTVVDTNPPSDPDLPNDPPPFEPNTGDSILNKVNLRNVTIS